MNMRWKLYLAFLLLVVLSAGLGYGWLEFRKIQIQRNITSELKRCQNYASTGQHDRVQTSLKALLADHPDQPNADVIWTMLAQSYEASDKPADASLCWNKIYSDYPDSKSFELALAALAREYAAQGKTADANKLWDQVLKSYPKSLAANEARLGRAKMAYNAGSLNEARSMLLGILNEITSNPALTKQVEDLLGQINLEMLYSPMSSEGDEIYTIKRGDKLETIGRRFKVSPDLIGRINNIRNPKNLVLGKRLRIPKTNFSVVVNKSDNTLLLLNNNEFFKRYVVRTGKDEWRTPVGEFRILNKIKNPPWTNPDNGRKYDANDPENELGTRWMAFQDNILGIHGTIRPETIGKYASNGCVGMLMEDVEELFDLIPTGTVVKITGKMQRSADAIH